MFKIITITKLQVWVTEDMLFDMLGKELFAGYVVDIVDYKEEL